MIHRVSVETLILIFRLLLSTVRYCKIITRAIVVIALQVVLQVRSCVPVPGRRGKVIACLFGLIFHDFVDADTLHDNQLVIWDAGSN